MDIMRLLQRLSAALRRQRGIFIFTSAADLAFRIANTHALGEPVQRVAQSQQINRAKGCSIRSNQPELVDRIDIRPRARDRAKSAVLVLIDHPVLAPMTAPADQLERATA
jgi:hypothetical protein